MIRRWGWSIMLVVIIGIIYYDDVRLLCRQSTRPFSGIGTNLTWGSLTWGLSMDILLEPAPKLPRKMQKNASNFLRSICLHLSSHAILSSLQPMLVYEYTRISNENRKHLQIWFQKNVRTICLQNSLRSTWLGLSAKQWMIAEQQLNTGRHLFCYAMFRDGYGLV